MDEKDPKSTLEDWLEIEAMFPTMRAMRLPGSWAYGVSARARAGRLSRLLAGPGAGPLAAKLDQMDDAGLKAMRTFAAVNLEQAAQGFRLTLVANVTVPVLFLTVANLLTPGGIGGFFASSFSDDRWVVPMFVYIAAGALLLLLVLTYALANLNQARDIRHIIDLQAADRGIYFGLEDLEDSAGS